MELVKKKNYYFLQNSLATGAKRSYFFRQKDSDELLYLSIPDLHSPIPLGIFAPEFHGSERPFVKTSGRVIKGSFS